MPAMDPTPIDFSGLSNAATRGAGYGQIMAPEQARNQPGTGYERAAFQLDKPPRPFILTYRPPGDVPPLV